VAAEAREIAVSEAQTAVDRGERAVASEAARAAAVADTERAAADAARQLNGDFEAAPFTPR
jgi:hypothetical protein